MHLYVKQSSDGYWDTLLHVRGIQIFLRRNITHLFVKVNTLSRHKWLEQKIILKKRFKSLAKTLPLRLQMHWKFRAVGRAAQHQCSSFLQFYVMEIFYVTEIGFRQHGYTVPKSKRWMDVWILSHDARISKLFDLEENILCDEYFYQNFPEIPSCMDGFKRNQPDYIPQCLTFFSYIIFLTDH